MKKRADFKIKLNKYTLQQREQRWDSNKHYKLQEIKPTLDGWKEGYRPHPREKTKVYCPDFV